MRSAEDWAKEVISAITMTPQGEWGKDETEFQAKSATMEQFLDLMTQALHTYAREVGETVREDAAKVSDEWACSTSCNPLGPCEHIRTASTIGTLVRQIEVKTP